MRGNLREPRKVEREGGKERGGEKGGGGTEEKDRGEMRDVRMR